MSLVGRLGLGARSWVHIGLGEKVRVSVILSIICAYSAITAAVTVNGSAEDGGVWEGRG